MRKVITALLLSCLCACAAIIVGCQANTTADEDWHTGPHPETIEITQDTIPAEMFHTPSQAGSYERLDYEGISLGETSEKYAYVYLPYGYDASDTETRYDVMYLFHGYGGDITTFMGSPDSPRDLKTVVDNLIANNSMNPMIIVSATFYPANGGPDIDMDAFADYKTELIERLIPAVEGTYNTYATSTDAAGIKASRDHRIFAGFSMGGAMVCQHMATCMDYFRYWLCMSGAIYWAVHDYGDSYGNVGDGAWVGDYLAQHIQEQGYGSNDFYLYMVTGTSDVAYDDMLKQVSALESNDFFVFDNETATGNASFWLGEDEHHNYQAKRRYLYNALPVLSALINKQAASAS